MKKGANTDEQLYLYEESKQEDDAVVTHTKELEKKNYRMALETKRKLDTISKTTDRTSSLLEEQREKLEEIRENAYGICKNVDRGRDLTVEIKRAGKFITVGDKIMDGLKRIVKRKKKIEEPRHEEPRKAEEEVAAGTRAEQKIQDSPDEEDTNKVLEDIRDGLKSLKQRIQGQQKEVEGHIPIVEEIKNYNKRSSEDAEKIIKDLKRM